MKNVFLVALFCGLLWACQTKQQETAPPVAAPPPPAEFADSKYAEIGKKSLAAFASGDVDGFLSEFADNAVFNWSAGDSLVGKEAITAYWKDRRANVIKSVEYKNDIWLPIKINTPQKGPDLPGVWLLAWYQVNATYASGQSLSFWVHTDYHFDANDKVDRAVQYVDRAPINAAVAAK